MRASTRRRVNMDKALKYVVAINGLQIAAALAAAVMSISLGGKAFNGLPEQLLLCGMTLVVCWGAALDIMEAFSARKLSEDADMLEAAFGQLEQLNGTLRAQRHDFLNHMQVVHSLIELGEADAATEYIERVCGSVQQAGRMLKTAQPAINALLAAKLSDCEARGIRADFQIDSAWERLAAPEWEMCRVLGNLLDNAIDALSGTADARVALAMGENDKEYTFAVENNGPAIPESQRENIFQSGFSTKGENRGMGLTIVSDMLKKNGGRLALASGESGTTFSGAVPKRA